MYVDSDKCENPAAQTNNSVVVIGYTDPAVKGNSIAFSCPPGLTVTGPTVAKCTETGEWEPYLGEVKCQGKIHA